MIDYSIIKRTPSNVVERLYALKVALPSGPEGYRMVETQRSHPHRRVERIMDELGISYVSECEEFPPYCLDIYVGEFHICIEVDGPSHTAKKNAKRDEFLDTHYYLPTMRIDVSHSGWSVDAARTRIVAFIEQHADSAAERKTKWREGRMAR